MFGGRYFDQVKAARYALFEQHGELGETPETFKTLNEVAARVAEIRGAGELVVTSGSFEWPGEARQALLLTIGRDQAERRFTLCSQGETPGQLLAALMRPQPAGRLL